VRNLKRVGGRKIYTETVMHICWHRKSIETMDKPMDRTQIMRARQQACPKCRTMALDAGVTQ